MVSDLYKIAMPTVDTAVKAFSFTTSIKSMSFTFTFKFLNDLWNVFVTMPDKSVRDAIVYPKVQHWTGFKDYTLVFYTDLDSVGLSDLQYVEAYIGIL